MSMKDKIAERRTSKRFQVKNGGYAVINHGPVIMAPIINMSSNGLAVRYKNKKKLLRTSARIDIFSSSANFYLINIQIDTCLNIKYPANLLSILKRYGGGICNLVA